MDGSYRPACRTTIIFSFQNSMAVMLLLLACSSPLPGHAVVFPGTAAAPEQARECLLRMFNQTAPRDRKVFSQMGEDGIIESIFECIGTTSKYYVEFGVQDGTECTTRNLRENHNFTGLMMDGGNYRPEINLQKEFVYSYNIVQLFQKHSVPHPSFDHLTVDLDQNTFGVALAVLRGGYRPRSLTVEFNRNFAWNDSGYAVIDAPDEMWMFQDACENGCSTPGYVGDCYFGASPRAWFNMAKSFGYHLVAADRAGVNLFFVHESAAGKQPLLSLDDAKRLFLFTSGGQYPAIHGACTRHAWLEIGDDVNFPDSSFDLNDLPLVLLSHKPGGENYRQRIFFETNVTGSLQERLRRPRTNWRPAPAAAQPGPRLVSNPATVLASEATLEVWIVVVMVVVSFVGGGLLQRFGGVLLRMP